MKRHIVFSSIGFRSLAAAAIGLCLLGLLTTISSAQITPSRDSYTNSADSSTNYGAAALLSVNGAKETSYIQFNLASIPPGASVSQATLKLYVNSVATPGSFNVVYVNGAWSEATITSELSPVLGTAIASNVSVNAEDKNQYILINVTPAVQAWLNGSEPNDGIALVANGAFSSSFDSKENTATGHSPELDIVFAAGAILQSGTSELVCVNAPPGTATANAPVGENIGGAKPMNLSVGCGGGGGGGGGGNETINGTLTVTETVSASSYLIGTNLFAFGSYSNGNAFLGFAGNTTTTGTVNTGSGYYALGSNTTGSYNTGTGYYALPFNTTGSYNTASGAGALNVNSTGTDNTASGGSALGSNTTGNTNTANGDGALYANTTGSNNTAAGSFAGRTDDSSYVTGNNNTVVGAYSAFSTGALTNATAIGASAVVGESNALVLGSINGLNGATSNVNVGLGTTTPAYSLDVHGTGNFTGAVAFGAPVTFASGQTFPGTGTITGVTAGTGLAGGGSSGGVTLNLASNACASGSALSALPFTCSPFATLGANTFTGNQTVSGNLSATGVVTGSSFQIGSNLFAFGSHTNANAFLGFAGNVTTTGGSNTAAGYSALSANTSGGGNSANGASALANNTTGGGNTASGLLALASNTSGANNTAMGNQTLAANATGSSNTAVGGLALYSGTGGGNTTVGADSMFYTTTGGDNTALGYYAGGTADGSPMTASYNSAVGAGTAVGTGTLTYATAIGANAEVTASNALVLGSIGGVGNCTTATSCASVNVGIGTTAPGATLDVHDSGYGFPATISATSGATNNAVQGKNTATSGNANGGLFITSSPQGSGIVAQNTGTGGNDYAAYLVGNVYISGNVSKGGGSFQIDHPLDPANKFLYHSFVESPDMMNVYNGNIVTNARGVATVVLPDYFEALNRDFRYQLTVIGQFAQAIVAKKIGHNRFIIRTSRPNVEVSWQVTGVRHDAYADAHRIEVEVKKPPQEQGRYLHPELFGAPTEQAIGYIAPPTPAGHAAQSETAHVSSAKTEAGELARAK